MLFDVPVLIADPRVAPIGLAEAVAQDAIAGNPAIVAQARYHAASAKRQARERVVEPDHDYAAGAYQSRKGGKRSARIGRVVENSVAHHHVETFLAKARRVNVRLDEPDAADTESVRRALRELQRRARQIGADHQAASTRQEQAELAGAAPHFQHRGIVRNGGVEAARKCAPRSARSQAGVAVAGPVSGKGCRRIEAADLLGSRVAVEP